MLDSSAATWCGNYWPPTTRSIVAYDNLSLERLACLGSALAHRAFQYTQGDLLDVQTLHQAIDGCEMVYHLAANRDVGVETSDTALDLQRETLATCNLLEAMRRHGLRRVALASSNTVYGVTPVRRHPKKEYGPLLPASLDGAAKLAAEGLVSAFCHLFSCALGSSALPTSWGQI